MPRLSVPTTGRLPSSLRVDPSNAAATRILCRLSRSSLLAVALDWLDDNNLSLTQPYLRRPSEYEDDDDDDDDETDDFYPPARSPEALREVYAALQERKGSKREVLDRITVGDWRHGLTLYQLAMADLQYLYDHPTSQRWSAYRVVPLQAPRDPDGEGPPPAVDKHSLTIPRFHPSTFLKTLRAQVLPDVKAHYTFDAHKTLPLLLLRIFILDSPYNTNLSLHSSSGSGGATTNFDASRTVYIAFPDASPHIFISKPQTTTSSTSTSTSISSTTSTTSTATTATSTGPSLALAGEANSLRALLVEGIPKALSRPLQRQRVTLQATSLATRNLATLVERRGAGRTNAAGGGWGWYADEGRGGGDGDGKGGGDGVGKGRETPLDLVLPGPFLAKEGGDRGEGGGGLGMCGKRAAPGSGEAVAAGRRERAAKRARLVARARFGDTAKVADGKGVERVDVVLEDAFPQRDVGGVEEGDEDDEDDEDGRETETGTGTGSRTTRAGRRKSQLEVALERAAADDEDAHDGEEERLGEGPAQGWRPYVRLTFHGPHVFAGIRQLVENGIIDGERMPGWMTGEEGVTIGAVRNGRIRGHKGSGL